MKNYINFRKITVVCAVALVSSLTSCEKLEGPSKEEQKKQLEALGKEIQSISGSFSCESASEWKFSPIGSKACGSKGPSGYIAYSVKADTVLLLKKIKVYTQMEEKFNEDNGVVSDCAMPRTPKAVVCQNGKPIFEY